MQQNSKDFNASLTNAPVPLRLQSNGRVYDYQALRLNDKELSELFEYIRMVPYFNAVKAIRNSPFPLTDEERRNMLDDAIERGNVIAKNMFSGGSRDIDNFDTLVFYCWLTIRHYSGSKIDEFREIFHGNGAEDIRHNSDAFINLHKVMTRPVKNSNGTWQGDETEGRECGKENPFPEPEFIDSLP